MAIYYIDPHTTTNGTGTWASPFSFGTNNSTTFTDGDEIRIKGVALTDLLIGSTYSATITDSITYNATGLGTAATAHDLWYVSEMDCFVVVYDTPTADTIRIGSNSTTFGLIPADDWTPGTTYTLQKVDTSTYGRFSTSISAYFVYNQDYDNITVSDCWVDVGGTPTRVTDGSVKTILSQASGGGTGGTSDTTLFFGPSATFLSISRYRTSNCAYGWTVNLNNTHILPGRGNNSVIWSRIGGVNHTVYINQLGGAAYMPPSPSQGSAWGGLVTYMFLDSTVNIATMQNTIFPVFNVLDNCTFNIGFMSGISGAFTSGSYDANAVASNITFNITNVSLKTFDYVGLNPYIPERVGFINSTLNITGNIDIFDSMGTNAAFIADAIPNNTYDFSSATFYDNRRTNTNPTPAKGLFILPLNSTTGSIGFNQFSFPWDNVTLSASYSSVTDGIQYNGSITNPSYTALQGPLYKPYVFTFTVANNNASNLLSASNNFATTYRYNTLVLRFLFLDGSDPQEYIIIQNKSAGYTVAEDPRYAMLCTKDATVYRTSGPSLKMYVQNVYAAWTDVSPTVYPSSDLTYFNGFTKTIKIPVSAAPTTVAGYIRSDYASTATGDCRVMILDDKYEVVTYQDMTNASYNSWESFSLNFTPTYAAEYHLAIRNLYPFAGKSFWLDDLTVS
jgi:hypothetical protein